MGSVMSEEEQRESVQGEVERHVKKFKNCADVRVNRAIVTFCSSSSSEILQQHLEMRRQTTRPAADWMKTLAEKLTVFTPNPKLAGLGALAFAVFIDAISASSSSEAPHNSLRCVFAEEKASEVWDHIDECLKRCTMHIDDDQTLLSNMERIERQLSAALTRLKNSVTRDGHVASAALKAWVNGAAFHVHMLIHLVRLGGIQTCDPVERLLSAYLSDLDTLFQKHKETVEKKCRLGYHDLKDSPYPFFETEEGEAYYVAPFVTFEEYFEGYYEEHYSSQKDEIRNYFRRVGDDLPKLLSQEGRLSAH